MKRMKKLILSLFVVSCGIFCNRMYAATIGSDSSVTNFGSQQTLNNGDRVASFAALKAGFALAGSGVTAEFDSCFRVGGVVSLNNGTLELSQDLILADVSEIRTLGNINGDFHTLELAKSTSCIPSMPEAVIDCATHFVDSSHLPDDGESVDWSANDQYIAVGIGGPKIDGSDTFRMYSFDGTDLTLELSQQFEGDSGSQDAEVPSVRWRPGSNTQLAVCRDKVSGSNRELLMLQWNSGPKTVSIIDGVNIDKYVVALAWRPDGNYLAIAYNNGRDDVGSSGGATIAVYQVDGAGNLTLTTATHVFSGTRHVQTQSLGWDATGTYIAAGLEGEGGANEIFIFEFTENGASSTIALDISAGSLGSEDVRALDWHPTYTDLLAVGTNAPTGGDELFIYKHVPGVSLTAQSISGSAKTNFDNHVRALHWSPSGSCLALGKSGGSDQEFRIYKFTKDGSSLTLDDVNTFGFSQSVETVRWSHDNQHIVIGSDDNVIKVYSSNAGSVDCVTLTDLCIFLNCNVELKQCCIKFAGQSLINGRGNCLTISPTCTIFVEPNSSLMFKDIILKGMSDHRIQAVDNTGTFSFKNVEWIQDGDFSFELGHFDVIKDWHLFGEGHQFNYQSSVQSTIQECGCMILDNNFTFSYDVPIADRDLLKLVEDTSKLALYGATLHSTTTGLRLTKGRLVIDRCSLLSSEATVESEGISFGDGTSVENNLDIQLLPAAKIDITQGCVSYNDA